MWPLAATLDERETVVTPAIAVARERPATYDGPKLCGRGGGPQPGWVIIMANQVDDMSAGPARGMPEPAPSAKPFRTKASDRPAASETTPKLDRKPVGLRATREAAAPDEERAGASANGTAGARTAVLRQGLPRTGAYRASVVTRSLHPTPVATPVVVATPVESTSAPAAVAEIPGAQITGDETASAMTASAEPTNAPAAVVDATSAPTAEVTNPRTAGAEPASTHAAGAGTATAEVEVSNAQRVHAGTATRTADMDATARPIGRRSVQIGFGLFGAVVLGGAILVGALGLSRSEARRDPRAVLPAAATLVQSVPEPSPRTVEVAPPPAIASSPAAKAATPAAAPPRVAETPAPAAIASAPAKPTTPAAAASAPARTDSPTPARPGASSAPREPVRAAKPASPPRTAPARPLAYDPDALFLPKP